MLALLWLINKASQDDGGVFYYVAPSYVQAKQIAWRQLKELVGDSAVKRHESELYVELRNGAIIQLKGADNPDSLRGVSLSGAVLDEAAFMGEDVWKYAIRPACSDKLAPVLFISSPSGWNWFKRVYDYAKSMTDRNWEAWQFTTEQGGNVPVEEIENARRELPPKAFNQEYLATFETLSNQVYSNFDAGHNLIKSPPDINPYPELHIGIDFNVAVMSAVIAVKVADQIHVIDELMPENSNTTELGMLIIEKYPNHKLIAYPDPSGRARKTSANVGVTDFTILEELGFYVVAPSKHPPISDRINTVQTLLKNAKGERRLFVHSNCQATINMFQGLTYDPKLGKPDKTLGLDHASDALGYMVTSIAPIGMGVKRAKFSGF